MTDALLAQVVPALPTLSRDGALITSALVVLATIALAGRAVLAWLALRRHSAAAAKLAGRLDEQGEQHAERIRLARTRLFQANAEAERALWALPALDDRLAAGEQRLAEIRTDIDAWRGHDGEGLRRTIAGIRGTLTLISAAKTFRRVIDR